ncbi:MAG: CehA/McbA family metallohydrolase [Ignavibacteriales bacterium]|nr:CehA/McbA family metallohydrolase [Ignavibacteriales bacterium]
MIHLPQDLWYLPLLLYAETHYKFRYFFSFLRKKEPELLADAPHRIEPGKPLPLLLLAKDADRHPCTLVQLHVALTQTSKVLFQKDVLSSPIKLDGYFWWEVFQLDVSQWRGWIDLHTTITIEVNGKRTTYNTDNHKTSSHKPLRVFLANDPLPRLPNLYLGDAHTHSNYTDDQVEFGSPLKASQELCKAMGISFFCVTDHSYDLDDCVDNYLKNDPAIPKWNSLQAELDELNNHHPDFAIVRGEEITSRNRDEKNVHLLLYGTKRFFHGAGDSAEKWLRTRSAHSVTEILTLKDDTAVAYAGHPKEPVPLLQRFLLGRDEWSDADLEADGLSGIQFANGTTDMGFSKGYRAWIQSLLNGKKLFALGGNDAHGNFNHFRQIGIPFVTIKEKNVQLFGKVRTGVFINEPLSEHTILAALKSGNTIVTDGPSIQMAASNEKGETTSIGGNIIGKTFQLSITARSTAEFGTIDALKVFMGTIGAKKEMVLINLNNLATFSIDNIIPLTIETASYIRAEAYTSGEHSFDNDPHWCFTNPIWLSPNVI